MELRHLRYFVAVAEALNFRRAAERLHVAQPALSKQIQQMEDRLGVKLLHRNTGGVRLTDAGAVMLDEARDILERVEMAEAAVQDAASGSAGRLNVGNLGAITACFLPQALSLFRKRYPQVEVNLIETGVYDQLENLQSGKVHLGFMAERRLALPPALEAVEVLSTRPGVVMHGEHALASHPSISLDDLAMESLLTVGEPGRQARHQQYLHEIFASRGIRHRPLRRVGSFESLMAMIESGLGVSILLPLARGTDNVVYRPIKEEGEDLTAHVFAVWRRGIESQILQNFLSTLRSTCKGYGRSGEALAK
ncbi:hypothetical protein AXK11_02125 [Cephaloticoccus primus]|uniref:HTH lysR-type domain-containing protein n=1 Tax=Cephaloticoccus primus TaxID=1548207 RepID=A0A139SSV1_9BACT|nr:LysR substrate-binding domain-containing protein [Cephaloticoccus primus]KXU37614.1 hypothetical protein AXK11_02125 [Cephaloticoccus primus]